MTATMLTKGLNKLSLNGSDKGPSDRDFIDHLNYEELERKFCVYKYYPQYIHNVEAPTPMIKDLISDKPIYAQANRHVKKKQRQEQKHERREEKRALREEKKEERKQNREEKRDLRQQQRQERRELRQEQQVRSKQQQAYPRHIANPNLNGNPNGNPNGNSNGNDAHSNGANFNGANANLNGASSHIFSANGNSNATRAKDVHIHNHINVNVMAPKIDETDELTFRNPFGSKPPTFEESQLLAKEPSGTNRSLIISTRMRRSSTQSSNKRHNSIASKFVNILMGNLSSGEDTPGSNDDNELHVSSSYDATKSNMTSSRSKKTNLLKLKLDPRRRMSEQIGKLLFFFPGSLTNGT